MTASEAKNNLGAVIHLNCIESGLCRNTETIKKICEALDLLEKVESMEYREVWGVGFANYARGYNACLEEMKKTIGGNDDGK